MRALPCSMLIVVVAAALAAQAPEPPLAESRLTVHTLLREDVFAGFLENDMGRFARAEQNIDALLASRPEQRANLLAWRGSASLYRAVLAHEGGRREDFEAHFARARDSFAAAAAGTSGNDGVPAVIGGSLVLFADRLPAESRAAAWAQAYDAFAQLWQMQQSMVAQLPVHLKGELLAGLAQSAQRTGRREEADRHVARLLELLAGTPYEAEARRWQADPGSAAGTTLTCKSCHNPGRLSARLRAIGR